MIDDVRFPSGRSVGNCRKDAKRLARDKNIPLHEALDQVAVANGAPDGWARFIQSGGTVPAPTMLLKRADVAAILAAHPYLVHNGLLQGWKRGESDAEREERRVSGRASLLEALDEVNKAVMFLRHVDKRATLNTRAGSSYGLKHSAERFLRALPERQGMNNYVSNGALLVAAIHLGLEFKPAHDTSPNAYFSISSRSPVMEWERLSVRVRGMYCSERDRARFRELCEQLGVSPAKSVA